MPLTICDVCGKKGARIRRVTRSYGTGKVEFLIRGIPVVSCPHCGESYLTAETLREIERIKLHRPFSMPRLEALPSPFRLFNGRAR